MFASWLVEAVLAVPTQMKYSASLEDVTKLHISSEDKPRSNLWGGGMIEQEIETDVFVAGGGSAGTAAAIAAARSGMRTVLVNGPGVLGGNAGSQIRVTQAGACGPRHGQAESNQFKLDCREGGIVEEYILNNAVSNPDHVPELFSLELLTMVLAEPNLTVFQNTWLVAVHTNSTSISTRTTPGDAPVRTITTAICEDQGSQRRYLVKAKVYIDATGDGRLGAEAGAEWIQGREGRERYNESLAVSAPDNETEGTTILFQARDAGAPRSFSAPFWSAKFNKSEFRFRSVGGQVTNGYWWNEVSWPYNTITDGENVTREAISNILGIWDYVKNSGDHPDSANMGLTWVGQFGGKREGRRFLGQYVMNQNDVVPDAHPKQRWRQGTSDYDHAPAPTLFPDRVAYSGWNFDLHNPLGLRDPQHPPYISTNMPYLFSTPLRSLVSKDLDNLFFAGRLASFSHVVFGSQRVMKTCATMGQAAGTAAAFAVRHGIPPYNLRDHPEAVWSIQQQLIRDDAFLIGVTNLDPRDHARNATVTASSEISPSDLSAGDEVMDGRADNVVTGQSRAVVTDGGVPVGHGVNGTNRWISKPGALPAWISLQLRVPMRLSQVELTFDTGMHRKLAFNPVGKSDDAQPWGAQPETVKEYVVQGRDPASGKWVSLCNITDNYQRKRIHRLPCAPPPSPAPAPPPAPVAAQGSITADLCVASPSQMWTFDSALKHVYTTTTRGRLCLGFDTTIPAFGGEGKSVVARPCTPNSTAWQLTKASGGAGRLLEVEGGSGCLNGPVCDTRKATTITISGAGTAAVNGVYKKVNQSFSDGMPVFELDSSHQLYRFAGQWKLAHMGSGPVYYVGDSHDIRGPPRGAASWSPESGAVPSPSHIGCDAAPPLCSCVHAVACAACHPTGTDGQVYIPPTSVELADCASSVTHITWLNLTIAPGDGDSAGGMLMSGGLCLGVAATHNTTVESVSAPPLLHRASTALSEGEGVSGSVEVDAVRVVVTATNGDPRAIINEVRLYEEDGIQPFPTPIRK